MTLRSPARVALGFGLAVAACNHSSTVPTETTPVDTPLATSAATTLAPAPPPTTIAKFGCGLPAGTGPGDDCPREPPPEYLDAVEASIDEAVAKRPENYDLENRRGCEDCYLVHNTILFEQDVIQALQKRGFCAIGGEEFGVKRTNAYNEQYDLLTSEQYIRRQSGAYRGTCYPAAF